MAYDHWADYEKHLNALRNAQTVYSRDFADLGRRQRTHKTQKASKDPMIINRANEEFFKYLNAVESENRTVEQLARSSIGKLNSYIRLVKPFAGSAQHFNNLNNVSRAIANDRIILSRARSQAQGF